MEKVKTYIQNLFSAKNIVVANNRQSLFDEFTETNESLEAVKKIIETQNLIMAKWKLKNRITDIIDQHIVIPNATMGKHYETKIDLEKLNLTDLTFKQFEGLEALGLSFNKETDTIMGTPTQSGDTKIKFLFRIIGETEATTLNEKYIPLVINPDPKSLWKDIPSDKENIFWKEDDVSIADKLGKKNIVVSSRRGRSHKNVGSFRDDDFAYKHVDKTGWSVVAISDGAGSYSLSRKGSQLACNSVVEYFTSNNSLDESKKFESKITEYNSSKDENTLKELEVLAKQNLYKASAFVHTKIKEHSEETFKTNPELFDNPKAKFPIDYYHSTLIFSMFKKYEFGYIVLTFSVGDCPIALMNKEQTETTLLNWLDVGEFGGGTRFITQADIFHSKEHPMVTRFNMKIIPDFSYLFLMTDGIYDAKFVVEANLDKNEKWIEFLEDLKGNNEDNCIVNFDKNNKDIADQLFNWMDFWSVGNHDDRTLAVIY